MKVIEAVEGLQVDSSITATKAVTLEKQNHSTTTDFFIKQDDVIKVRTEDETYVSRV